MSSARRAPQRSRWAAILAFRAETRDGDRGWPREELRNVAEFVHPMPGAPARRRLGRVGAALATAGLLLSAVWAPAAAATGTYRNPIEPTIAGDGIVESCADPTIIQGQKGEGRWYMYCTTDPLNDEDKTGSDFNFHLIPTISSADLVHWRYEKDAFTTRPAYATSTAGLWAPEIIYHPENTKYYLYYTVTDTTLPGGGSAIGVATSDTPLGPWTQATTPVVEPHAADCCPGSRRWVYDPEVQRTDGADYLYYGSYFGGISARVLSEDGFTTNPATQVQVAIDNKFEGAEVEWHDGYYYLFASATDCCRGPLTGYAVFVGRSVSPVGPFVDAEGVSMLAGRAGGTPVIYQNGNRWVGTGHNVVFQDANDQWWTIYHAVDVNDPYFAGAVGFTKRPALMDALDWVNGWPVVNGGRGPSDTPQQAPAARAGDTSNHRYRPALTDVLRKKIGSSSDEFNDG